MIAPPGEGGPRPWHTPPPGSVLALVAHGVAERVDVTAAALGPPLVRRPLVVPSGARGLAVVFRYGAVVTVEMAQAEEKALLERLTPALVDPFDAPEREALAVVVDPGAKEEGLDEGGRLVLREADVDRLRVVAEALAKSTLLAHHEIRVAGTLDRIEPLAERMRAGRPPVARHRPLVAQLGEVLLDQIRTTGRVEVTEKPEITWDRPDLDRLWERLAVEYELVERERALSRKLELALDITGTLVDLAMERRTLRVEWYIVFLIVFEIALTLLAMAGVL